MKKDDYSSSVFTDSVTTGAGVFLSLRNADITLASLEIDGSICSIESILIERRGTLWRLPNVERRRWLASSSSLAIISCKNG